MHLFSISCINRAFLTEILSRLLYCGSQLFCGDCCVCHTPFPFIVLLAVCTDVRGNVAFKMFLLKTLYCSLPNCSFHGFVQADGWLPHGD